MSVVSQAGPDVQLGAQALEKAADAGLFGFVRHRSGSLTERLARRAGAMPLRGYDAGSDSPQARQDPAGGRNSVRIIGGAGAAGACSFPGFARPAAHARPRARDLVQLAAAFDRGHSLPGSVCRLRRARTRGAVARGPRGGVRRAGIRAGADAR